MRRMIAAALVVVALVAAGCSRSEAGAEATYCAVVVATHEQAVTGYAQNTSGTPRSATAIPSIMASRSAVAPSEISVAWMALLAGPGMESDGNGAQQKDREFEAALETVGAYDQTHCGVVPDLAPPKSVTVR